MTTRGDMCSGEVAQEELVVGATFRARQLTNVCAEINTMHTSMVPELLLVRTLSARITNYSYRLWGCLLFSDFGR